LVYFYFGEDFILYIALMKKIKSCIGRLLLWLLKLLKMPKPFNQLRQYDLYKLAYIIYETSPFLRCNYPHIVPINFGNAAVIDYTKHRTLSKKNIESGRVDYSIEIDKNLNIRFKGFKPNEEAIVALNIDGWLISNGYK